MRKLLRKLLRKLRRFTLPIIRKALFLTIKFYLNIFKPKGKLTCNSPFEGAGSQLQRQISVILICEFYKIEFCYSGLKDIGLAPINQSNQQYISNWEKVFNFDLIYNSCKENNNQNINLILALLWVPFTNKTISIYHAHAFADLFPNRYNNLDLINQYKLNIVEYKEKIVSIHYRYPTGNEDYLQVINERGMGIERLDKVLIYLNLLYPVSNYKYIIYSTASIDYFSEILKNHDYISIDNVSSEIQTFKRLINSEILVISKSSFSYTAGLFNTGKKYYFKFFHNTPKDWIELDKNI